ncbi:MAG: 6-phosphogluconate dehydrogenase (decarboxylating) [Sorangiineae bacterium NIC37A_2]|jgi:6-phosphogluconate dehydrogenase|nr:MAG: 6-phosphogluconate dehydrogenase (decarboxylating) [Sorangiineae bacterium NIC37A_2]
MELAIVGLGRMGANMARRLVRAGHRVVGWDRDPSLGAQLEAEGIVSVPTLEALVQALTPPRAVWMMVPAAVTSELAEQLAPLLSAGDTLIDGGNSHYRDAVDRAEALAKKGIYHLDVGTSGGVHGLSRGYCLMIGGDEQAVHRLDPIFRALAPGFDAAPRTASRSGPVGAGEEGFLHCGPPGAGHFVKMVHNGIEYALMAAYAEGFNLLRNAGIGKKQRDKDAETAPLKEQKYYQFDFPIADVAELWRRGSVIPSWLLDLTADALHSSPALSEFSGTVSDSGEGRWTILAAVDEGVPAHVLSAALFDRFESRGRAEFANKILSAMRLGFGGHHEKKRPPEG